MKIPNGERADLGTKIEDYSLNPLHREGRHKARVFASVLGITRDNAGLLRRAVLEAAATSDDAESRGDNGYGEVFVLRLSAAHRNRLGDRSHRVDRPAQRRLSPAETCHIL